MLSLRENLRDLFLGGRLLYITMNVRRSSVAHLHQDGLDTLKALKMLHRHRTHQNLGYTLKDYVGKSF